MSFAHIRMYKISENDAGVRYVVESSDFDKNKAWLNVGEVEIDKVSKEFDFRCTGAWENKKVVPPFVYGLSDERRTSLLVGKFCGYGYGAWTAKVLRLIRMSIQSNVYPQRL